MTVVSKTQSWKLIIHCYYFLSAGLAFECGTPSIELLAFAQQHIPIPIRYPPQVSEERPGAGFEQELSGHPGTI